ncbi:MAG: XRE family transcriptional regulator, partial [Pseudomonadota bacterium]
YAELGLVRRERLTATEQTMLHVARARCLARMGRVEDTIAAVGSADDCFARQEVDEDPPWMAYYDSAQHLGDSGHALYEIAIQQKQRTTEAVERLETAVCRHTDAYARSRAFSRSKLAALTIVNGDTEEAIKLARLAISDFSAVNSARSLVYLRELASISKQHQSKRDSEELTALRRDIDRAIKAYAW